MARTSCKAISDAVDVAIAQTSRGRALREAEAAERLGVSEKTLPSWRCRHKGPRFARFGRAIRYFERDLDDYATAHLVDPEVPGE